MFVVNSDNKLVIVRGLPGSGKTYFVNSNRLFDGYVKCEADDYHYRNGVYQYNANELMVAHAFCQHKAFLNLYAGNDVVVSNTFTTKKEALPYIRYCQLHEIKWVVYECHGCWQNVHDVPDEILEVMRERWESFDDLISEPFCSGIKSVPIAKESEHVHLDA